MNVLVCPLNWGLGHATRCIPLIQSELVNGNKVIIASDGMPEQLLKAHFPELIYIQFPSYQFRYSRGNSLIVAMSSSIPAILSGIIREHYQLKKISRDYNIDKIISDNRFGCFNKKVQSVYITHQLNIMMPGKLKWAEKLIRKIHYLFINQYDRCLIPDYPGAKNLSGALSHGFQLPRNAQFIGPLSRFDAIIIPALPDIYENIAIVSGPEPQRTLFQQQLSEICLESGRKSLLICGLPGKDIPRQTIANLTILPHLTTAELAGLLVRANKIYCRSGYSTIMDLDALGCLEKAVLFPTPGQTEQEYLGEYHRNKF